MTRHHFHYHFNSEEHQARKRRSILFWGIFLILVGSAFLAKNLGFVDFEIPSSLLSWKLIPLLITVNLLLHGRYIGALVLATISLIVFAPELVGEEMWTFKKKLLPLIPIFIGALFLSRLGKKKRCEKHQNNNETISETMNKTIEDNNELDTTLILSGGSKKINSYDFRGGKITTIMGGLELDLSNCTLSNNKAIIEVTTVMGGISLNVPREWNVKLDITPILGGVDDGIRKTPNAYVDPAAELIITGTVVMGGVEINRV